MSATKTKKITWTSIGYASIGDVDGPIRKHRAEVNGVEIVRVSPMVARTTYAVRGESYRTLSAALAAAQAAETR